MFLNQNFKAIFLSLLFFYLFDSCSARQNWRCFTAKGTRSLQVTLVPSGWHPENVRINSWAKITDVFSVRGQSIIEQLLDYHIWHEEFIQERFKWKPQQPLYLLLLRVYRLSQSVQIPFRPKYGGCRSWIQLVDSIAIANSIPVLDERHYAQQVETIKQIVHSS